MSLLERASGTVAPAWDPGNGDEGTWPALSSCQDQDPCAPLPDVTALSHVPRIP
jgi:hypothetical protein